VPNSQQFDAKVVMLSFETYQYTGILVPEEMGSGLGTRGGPLRVLATLKGTAIHSAVMPGAEGTKYILISKRLQKQLGISVGDPLVVTL
jgi:hypothetical protein